MNIKDNSYGPTKILKRGYKDALLCFRLTYLLS